MGMLSFPEHLADAIRQNTSDIVVTGGGGWIGQAALEMLDAALGDALAKRVRVFGSSNRDLVLRSGKKIACEELDKIRAVGAGKKLFFHCAFLTKDRLADQTTDAFIAGNKAISDAVATAIEGCDAQGLFMPSSGAVYKKGTHILDDDLNANPYGVMKHADEQRFVKLAADKKMPVCIPRLFNLSGPFINKIELYALASMITACLNGDAITIRAPHRVIRSYIYVANLVALGFAMLLQPRKDDVAVFDTAGADALELSQLAVQICNALGRSDMPIQRPPIVTDKDDLYVGDGNAFIAMMAAHGLTLTPIDEQILQTAEYIKMMK